MQMESLEVSGLRSERTPRNPTRVMQAQLVRQPHGGALKRGGNWGNRGGGSRSLRFKRRLVELRDEEEALTGYVQWCLKGLWGHRAALDARRYIDGLEE